MREITLPIVILMTVLSTYSCSVSNSNPTSSVSMDSPTNSQKQTVVKFAASSSTVKILTLLAKAYKAKYPDAKVELISTNSQSEGAIAALKNDIVDVVGSSHKLTPEEDNGKIQYREVVQDLLTVATHKSVKGVTNLSTAQLKAIYKGEITNWKELGGDDAAIVLLDRPEDESAKKLLRKYYLGKDKTTDKAVVLSKEGELIDTLKSTPYSIGAFSLATSLNEKLPVNRLSLNDATPTTNSFDKGQYPMVRHLGIVWHKTPKPTTQKFIDFIFSPEASQLLQGMGFVVPKTVANK
ncbi:MULTISPECIES: substrate-binding domain-containing protein [Pseudanabaena]|uniref:Phosphate ABC transporter substrate-binding protein, PhoT family n=2 Tax=Pseudanabaena TaxID=1152 RepID=L8N3C9_9CYAN|nr:MULTISPECIES: substrate-binding domain-containing protein [Pseudanabaena]ELS33604.1 phosphate ABC transporter substrate-binding protein, PhoT family [Pseudanabaena biceps PCC 7429]MDG3494158.1 substrate-binding domain-containing protein [Pseudanabaena catenata USMAC16]